MKIHLSKHFPAFILVRFSDHSFVSISQCPFCCVLLELIFLTLLSGRGIAEAVSRWLPTAVARVWQVGFVVDKMASGQPFTYHINYFAS
jgi:hypothetical protein